ncbi:thiol-disulfide oxidoreductase DCC family protein [soil metagenome]
MSSPTEVLKVKHCIIIFDGYCNFCSGSIDFIIRHDQQKFFYFTASQLPSGSSLIEKYQVGNLDSVVLIYEEKVYRYSTAVLMICSKLSFPWNLMRLFFIVPVFIRDPIYKWLAAYRYRWFGKRLTCRMPDPKDADRFL